MPQAFGFRLLVFVVAGLMLPAAANAANAVAKRPASIHAAPNSGAKVLGLIGVSQVVDAKTCKKGWCRVGKGYVRTSYLRFVPVRKGYENDYDYNVPLALPPYGYTPGFWGYGGRRYYDRNGNYTKYGVRGYAGTEDDRLGGTVETRPGRPFGVR
ncbi:hypothetical protein [Methyloceanibacter sp.]|jgi:hypothetical protein|uniref:hypothetical protein n=1 Tax=Methyloceanibacter sp. TaxID=1965321 RepID=UPI0035690FAA